MWRIFASRYFFYTSRFFYNFSIFTAIIVVEKYQFKWPKFLSSHWNPVNISKKLSIIRCTAQFTNIYIPIPHFTVVGYCSQVKNLPSYFTKILKGGCNIAFGDIRNGSIAAIFTKKYFLSNDLKKLENSKNIV